MPGKETPQIEGEKDSQQGRHSEMVQERNSTSGKQDVCERIAKSDK